MRLTLINQYYPPELAPTGHLAASVARHRAALGDQVTVVTSRGGYVSETGGAAAVSEAGVSVRRLWTPRLGKSSSLRRLTDYAVFFLLAVIRLLFLPRQDVILALTTPPFIVVAGWLHRMLHPNTKLVLWSMDCYPEVIERAGTIKPGGFLARAMHAFNRRLMARLDRIVCLDDAMSKRFAELYLGDRADRLVTVIPNWEPLAEYDPSKPTPGETSLSELGLDDSFVVIYLGNAGVAHQFEEVLQAAHELADHGVAFVLVGGGSAWSLLQGQRVGGLPPNLHLLRYVPKQATPGLLGLAQLGLITLRDEFLGLISPSKLHAYLAMGLPVLYVGPAGGNVDDAILRYKVGVSLRQGDVAGIVSFVRRMQHDPAALREYSRRAREAFLAEFSDTVALPRFDRLLEALTGQP